MRGKCLYLVVPLVALALSSCRVFDYEQREPWRTEAEEKCLAEKTVQPSAFMEPESELDGRGACGIAHPFKVSAMDNGAVGVTPSATLACPIIGAVDRWIAESVQPAAQTWFGEQVVEIHQISAYSCRPMNGQPGNHISEHAFGNALDVAAFKLASGREIVIKDAWKRGSYEEQGFLHDIITDACERFTTVLGPGSNVFHYDHFHLDLSRRASGNTYCKPVVARFTPPSQNLYAKRAAPAYRQASAPAPAAQQGPYVVTRDSYPQPQRRYEDLPLGQGAPQYEPQPRPSYPQAAGAPMNVSPNVAPPPAPQPSYQPSYQPPYAPAPAYAPQPQPYYPPANDPYRPLPPRNVGARLKSKDDIVTGSIGKQKHEKTLARKPAPQKPASAAPKPAPKAQAMTSGDLFSPVPMAKQSTTPSSADIGQAALKALKN